MQREQKLVSALAEFAVCSWRGVSCGVTPQTPTCREAPAAGGRPACAAACWCGVRAWGVGGQHKLTRILVMCAHDEVDSAPARGGMI